MELQFDDLAHVELLIEALTEVTQNCTNPKTKSDYEYLRHKIIIQTSKFNLFPGRIQKGSERRIDHYIPATESIENKRKVINYRISKAIRDT